MIDPEILDIVAKLLGGVVAILIAWITPKLREWLMARTDEATTNEILALVVTFAQAAEQLLHDDDPTGEKRKAYVIEQLEKLGVKVTDAVLAMIEGAVWQINTDNKAVSM